MIEFCGELSEKSKSYLLKKNAIIGLLSSSVISVILGIIIFVIAKVYDLWIITLFLTPLVLFVLLASIAPYIQKKNTLKLLIPKKICIDDEDIYYELDKAVIKKSLSDVKKIYDFGKVYLIKLYFPKVDGFICQKNLITKGTLEEFEQLFEGKIIRKSIPPLIQ